MFLKDNQDINVWEGSIFHKMYEALLSLMTKLFKILGLTKTFDGSMFAKPVLWCVMTAFFAPILPTMLVLALAALGYISLMVAVFTGKIKLKYMALNKYIFIYAGIYIFSTFASVASKGSFYGGLLTVFFILFFVVVVNSVETKRGLYALIILFVVSGLFVSFYGMYQYMFPDKFSGLWHDVDMFESIRFRVYSTLGNPNVFGEYLLLVIPFAAGLVLTRKKYIEKLFFLGTLGVMMLCLVLTYSRGCYIGVLISAAVFLVLLDRRFIILGLLGLLALPFVLPEAIINRFLSIGNMSDSSTSYRVYIWMGTISMLKDYWFSGIGPGEAAFNKVYPVYAYNSISAPHAHNLYLQIICDAGICGIAVFAAIIYQYYKRISISLSGQMEKGRRILMIAAVSGVSGFLVQSLFDYTFYNYRVTLTFWIVLAISILLADDSLKGGDIS
ncbi:MAG: O-antigen ligase family protein [Lachnospiraceae bacterium]|nr:O-antigen ligase family protein [Lachnospiraceae bacterium]